MRGLKAENMCQNNILNKCLKYLKAVPAKLFGTDPQKKAQHDDFNLDMRIMQTY